MGPSLNTWTCWKEELLLNYSMKSGKPLQWWCFTKRCCFKLSICFASRSQYTQGQSLISLWCEASSLKLRLRMKILLGKLILNQISEKKLSPDIVLKLGHFWALLLSCCFNSVKKSRTQEWKVFGEIWFVHWTVTKSNFAMKFYRNPHHRKFCLFYPA